jgi:hypothetical protein
MTAQLACGALLLWAIAPGLAATTAAFNYSGADQFFAVPAGVSSLTVKLWGAGGGYRGGSGALVTGDLAVTPGEVLTLIVGGGGKSNAAGYAAGAYGGGGGHANLAGGGGGRSAIRRGVTELATAAAGGGGGGYPGASAGGAAGVSVGGKGGGASDQGGEGGTQVSGGATYQSSPATAGSAFQGGEAYRQIFVASGGGGGGYFGGGGGGGVVFASSAGGGGGSSLLSGLTSASGAPGSIGADSGVDSGGAGDPDYGAGVGVGGAVGAAGGPGRIVLIYSPTVTISPAAITVPEEVGSVTVTGILSFAEATGCSVQLVRNGGTAGAGSDYGNIFPATMTFPAGQTTATVTIAVINGVDYEGATPETLNLELQSPSGLTIGSQYQSALSISDAFDIPPSISFIVATYTQAEEVTVATTTLALSKFGQSVVSFSFATNGSTATGGVDANFPAGTYTFPIGTLTQSISYAIANDVDYDPDETIVLSIIGLVNATPGPVVVSTLTISDDFDIPPVISFTTASSSQPEETSTKAVNVSLNKPGQKTVSYAFAKSGSATPDTDYTVGGDTSIAIGNTSGTVTISIIDDAQAEPDETVSLQFQSVVNAYVGAPSSFTLTIDDALDHLAANIDPAGGQHAWAENAGWINLLPDGGGVTVVPNGGGDGYLTGYAWAENVGWIKMGDGTGPYANNSASDWGVNMNAAGALSGYAWSENAGWINFDSSPDGRVTINTTSGEFSGFAWGENIGWIHFRNVSPLYGVRTTVFGIVFSGTVFKFW